MRREDVAVVVVCAAVFVVLIMPLRGSIVDDTYIHLQYARNLAETGELSFNRGDPTYGATSPLWVALLAVVYRMGGDLLTWCRVLSWIFGAATIVLVYHLAFSLDGRRSAAAAAALLASCEAWLLRWSSVGMETSFAVFMVLAVLCACVPAARSASRSALLGLLLLLAVLARPEAMLLVPLTLITFATGRDVPLRIRFTWLLVFVPLFVLWLLLIKHHTGTYLPLTAGAKQGRLIISAEIFRRSLVPVKIMGATLTVPWLAVGAAVITGLVRHRSPLVFLSAGGPAPPPRRPALVLSLLWIFALPLVYVLFDFQVLSRYLVPVTPAVIVLGVIGILRMSDRFLPRAGLRSAVLVAATAAVIVQNVVFYSLVVVPPTRAFSRGLREVVARMGEWLERNTDAEAVVAAPDIGAIGFISKRTVLDLGGLVTPEINRMRRRIDVERIIAEGLYLDFGPDFLVDRSESPARFAGKVIRGVRFEPVMQGIVPNLGIRMPNPVVYVLYRLEEAPTGGVGD